MSSSVALGFQSDEQFFNGWNPDFDFFENLDHDRCREKPDKSNLEVIAPAEIDYVPGPSIFLDLLKTAPHQKFFNPNEKLCPLSRNDEEIDAVSIGRDRSSKNGEFTLADLYFKGINDASQTSDSCESQTELSSIFFNDCSKVKKEPCDSKSIPKEEQSTFDFSFLESEGMGNDSETHKLSLTSLFLIDTQNQSTEVCDTFFKDDQYIDLSHAKSEFKTENDPSEPRDFLFDNSEVFSKREKRKNKSSLFCKVLCAKLRPAKDLSSIPKHPEKLQDLLESVGYWQSFKFDTPSPDEIVKQKQKMAFKRSGEH